MQTDDTAVDGKRDRCAGVLVGLAAGDRNGGPVRLAIRLLESLLEKKGFDKSDVVEKYLSYFRGPPHDSEKAFDTGHTFFSVFKLISEGRTSEEASTTVQGKYGSIGVGAAHRNAVISMASVIDDKQLDSAVLSETYITHANQISYEVSLFVTWLCRQLITGTGWEDSIKIAMNGLHQCEVTDAIISAATCMKSRLSKDGYAPAVLQAALHFLHQSNSFDDALNASIAFAGCGNFCPVLVGTIGGARYGARVILGEKSSLLLHCTGGLLTRIISGATNMGDTWK